MAGCDEWSVQSTAVSHCHHLIISLQEASCMKGLKLLLLENNTWKTMSRWIILLEVQFQLAQGRHFREVPRTELTNQPSCYLEPFSIFHSVQSWLCSINTSSHQKLHACSRKVTIYMPPSQLFRNEELNFQYPSWQVILTINFISYCF